MFFDRLSDVGANGQWGLFSMTIPGRVGYQVNDFNHLSVYQNLTPFFLKLHI